MMHCHPLGGLVEEGLPYHAPYKACSGRRVLICHAHLTLYA